MRPTLLLAVAVLPVLLDDCPREPSLPPASQFTMARTLVVATPEGSLVAFDADTGAELARVATTAADVLAHEGRIASIEPKDDGSGHCLTYDARSLAPLDTVPFPAADGRVLTLGQYPLVLGRGDANVVFLAGETHGKYVGTIASAIARDNSATLLDVGDDPTLRAAMLSGTSVTFAEFDPVGVYAGDDVRLVTRGAKVAPITLKQGEIRLLDEQGEIVAKVAETGTSLEDAIGLPDGEVLALVGPEAAIVSVTGQKRRVLGTDLSSSPTVRHLLAYDAATHRVHVALDSGVRSLDATTLDESGPHLSVGAIAVTLAL